MINPKKTSRPASGIFYASQFFLISKSWHQNGRNHKSPERGFRGKTPVGQNTKIIASTEHSELDEAIKKTFCGIILEHFSLVRLVLPFRGSGDRLKNTKNGNTLATPSAINSVSITYKNMSNKKHYNFSKATQ